MKKQLAKLLSLLCVLALATGCLAGAALAEDTPKESRIITVEWLDNNNEDGLRPDSLSAKLNNSTPITLDSGNGWTGEVLVPVGLTGENWDISAPAGYSKTPATVSGDDSVARVSFSHTRATTSFTGEVTWDDEGYAAQTRPDSVKVMLLADDSPCSQPVDVKASEDWKKTWTGLPKYKYGTVDTPVTYSVKQVEKVSGYTTDPVSNREIKNTLQMAAGLNISFSVSGQPDGTDLSGLTLTVDGPNPGMPVTLTYAQLASGSYSFGPVLPGAYLVRGTNAIDLVEGYTMDQDNSHICDAVYVKPGETEILGFKFTYRLPEKIEDVDPEYDPWSNINNLSFEILGPDDNMPINLTYADFTNGEKTLPDLAPGTYVVVERNAENLVKYYTLTSDSEVALKMAVTADGQSSVRLFNQYVPAPTPEPDAEFVDVPVTKTWNDNDDKDGNRPPFVTARLYADGVEIANYPLTAENGWKHTFTDLPRYLDDNKTEIVYTVGEDAVPMYSAQINGYNIVNDYTPELTSISVSKVWKDDNDALKLRPTSIAMTLSDGQKDVMVVVLKESNGWTATVNNLPTVVNGKAAKYSWKEQDVLSYVPDGVQQKGSEMIFTNRIWEPDETPPTTGKTPPRPTGPYYPFDDYDTPLGVEIVINHVGDCFD